MTYQELESFDDFDLTVLFPEMSAAEMARVRVAAARLNEARLPDGKLRWGWFPENLDAAPAVTRSAPMPIVVDGSVWFTGHSEVMELTLEVYRETPPAFTVSADLGVECWCDPDHGTHYVRNLERLVGTGAALADAVEAAVNVLVAWSAETHDPSVHRTAAGLPNPQRRA